MCCKADRTAWQNVRPIWAAAYLDVSRGISMLSMHFFPGTYRASMLKGKYGWNLASCSWEMAGVCKVRSLNTEHPINPCPTKDQALGSSLWAIWQKSTNFNGGKSQNQNHVNMMRILLLVYLYGGFHRWGSPQNRWLVREHLIQMDDLGVPLS